MSLRKLPTTKKRYIIITWGTYQQKKAPLITNIKYLFNYFIISGVQNKVRGPCTMAQEISILFLYDNWREDTVGRIDECHSL